MQILFTSLRTSKDSNLETVENDASLQVLFTRFTGTVRRGAARPANGAHAFESGGRMASRILGTIRRLLPLIFVAALPAAAQSFRVQCPASTITHPSANNNAEPAYTGATTFTTATAKPGNAGGYLAPATKVNGAIKCQQISGGDGYSTMGDGTQTYMFSFGPLSGLAEIAAGRPGTVGPTTFNTPYSGAVPLLPGDPATSAAASRTFTYNGAIGQVPDMDNGSVINGHVDPRQIEDIGVMNGNIPAPLIAIDEDDEFFLTLSNVGMIMRPDLFEQHTVHFHGYPNASSYYDGV